MLLLIREYLTGGSTPIIKTHMTNNNNFFNAKEDSKYV
jgi:hypothetical protein